MPAGSEACASRGLIDNATASATANVVLIMSPSAAAPSVNDVCADSTFQLEPTAASTAPGAGIR